MYHGNFHATQPSGSPDSAWGVCDLCGQVWDHNRLRFQWDWAGTELINKHLLVCPACYDEPFVPGKTILLPPDPIPIQDPRPPAWTEQEGETDPTIPNPWPD